MIFCVKGIASSVGFYPFCSQKKEQIGTFRHARAELKADSKKEA